MFLLVTDVGLTMYLREKKQENLTLFKVSDICFENNFNIVNQSINVYYSNNNPSDFPSE